MTEITLDIETGLSPTIDELLTSDRQSYSMQPTMSDITEKDVKAELSLNNPTINEDCIHDEHFDKHLSLSILEKSASLSNVLMISFRLFCALMVILNTA